MDILLDNSIYSIDAIRNAVYWFSKDYEILVRKNDDSYIVSSDNFDENSRKEFIKSLNDFALRDQISKETKDIKNLVISKAFYPDLVKFKDIGEFDDPINILKKNGN